MISHGCACCSGCDDNGTVSEDSFVRSVPRAFHVEMPRSARSSRDPRDRDRSRDYTRRNARTLFSLSQSWMRRVADIGSEWRFPRLREQHGSSCSSSDIDDFLRSYFNRISQLEDLIVFENTPEKRTRDVCSFTREVIIHRSPTSLYTEKRDIQLITSP